MLSVGVTMQLFIQHTLRSNVHYLVIETQKSALGLTFSTDSKMFIWRNMPIIETQMPFNQYWYNVGLRCWTNVKPTLSQCIVSVGRGDHWWGGQLATQFMNWNVQVPFCYCFYIYLLTFVQHRPNVFVQYCTNVIKMFCGLWLLL